MFGQISPPISSPITLYRKGVTAKLSLGGANKNRELFK